MQLGCGGGEKLTIELCTKEDNGRADHLEDRGNVCVFWLRLAAFAMKSAFKSRAFRKNSPSAPNPVLLLKKFSNPFLSFQLSLSSIFRSKTHLLFPSIVPLFSSHSHTYTTNQHTHTPVNLLITRWSKDITTREQGFSSYSTVLNRRRKWRPLSISVTEVDHKVNTKLKHSSFFPSKIIRFRDWPKLQSNMPSNVCVGASGMSSVFRDCRASGSRLHMRVHANMREEIIQKSQPHARLAIRIVLRIVDLHLQFAQFVSFLCLQNLTMSTGEHVFIRSEGRRGRAPKRKNVWLKNGHQFLSFSSP